MDTKSKKWGLIFTLLGAVIGILGSWLVSYNYSTPEAENRGFARGLENCTDEVKSSITSTEIEDRAQAMCGTKLAAIEHSLARCKNNVDAKLQKCWNINERLKSKLEESGTRGFLVTTLDMLDETAQEAVRLSKLQSPGEKEITRFKVMVKKTLARMAHGREQFETLKLSLNGEAKDFYSDILNGKISFRDIENRIIVLADSRKSREDDMNRAINALALK